MDYQEDETVPPQSDMRVRGEKSNDGETIQAIPTRITKELADCVVLHFPTPTQLRFLRGKGINPKTFQKCYTENGILYTEFWKEDKLTGLFYLHKRTYTTSDGKPYTETYNLLGRTRTYRIYRI
jgi:hypothetical protein